MNVQGEITVSGAQDMAPVTLTGSSAQLDVGDVSRVALSLPVDAVSGYERHGDDLYMKLANGEIIHLVGFFRFDEDGQPLLFLVGQAEGDDACLVEVAFADNRAGVLDAVYSPDSCGMTRRG